MPVFVGPVATCCYQNLQRVLRRHLIFFPFLTKSFRSTSMPIFITSIIIVFIIVLGLLYNIKYFIREAIAELKEAGATWIQFDEATLVKDLEGYQYIGSFHQGLLFTRISLLWS